MCLKKTSARALLRHLLKRQQLAACVGVLAGSAVALFLFALDAATVWLEPSLPERVARDHPVHHLQHRRYQLGLCGQQQAQWNWQR